MMVVIAALWARFGVTPGPDTAVDRIPLRLGFQRILGSMNLSGALLHGTNFEGATFLVSNLSDADLTGANLRFADLSGTNLRGTKLRRAKLEGVSLIGALLNADTVLEGISLDQNTCITDVYWNSSRLSLVSWTPERFGDEYPNRQMKSKKPSERITVYRNAARAYHGLVVALREQGLAEPASQYHLREMVMRRQLLWQQRNYGGWLLNILLDAVAGHGEKPGRAFIAYLGIVSIFAAIFWCLTNFLHTPGQPSLNIGEAVVLSLSSFHGRGFFTNTIQLGDPLAYAAAFEAVSGLFIELIFIATFSRRFLGD
jgi:uncharacterized protein YjbI with pentapeptide repeats